MRLADETLLRSAGRRQVLRGAALMGAGLAAAALLGCSSSKSSGNSTGTTAASATGGASGAPKNIQRSQGVPSQDVPVNSRKFVQGGTFTIPVTSTYNVALDDPQLAVGGDRIEAANDHLVYANGFTGAINLDLATSFETVDKDGLGVVIKIRPGVKTHNIAPWNGRIFTAKDVAYSLMRQAGKPSVVDPSQAARYLRAQQFVGLEKAEAVDDTTVRVTFSRPNGSFKNVLADPRANMILVEQDQVGWRDPMKLGGTGPWVETEWVDGQHDKWKAFPDYYRGWDEGGRPGFENYEQVVIADRASTLAAFVGGQVQMLGGILPSEQGQLSRVKGLQEYYFTGAACQYLQLNVTNQFFKDARVRKAMDLILDRKVLNDPTGRWAYVMATHPNYPENFTIDQVSKMAGYNEATKQQDIADGVKLMEAAGYKDGAGFAFQFHPPIVPSWVDNYIRIVDQIKKALPQSDLKPGVVSDPVVAQNKLAAGDFVANLFPPTHGTDIAADMRTYYHTDAIKGGRNNGRYSEPYVDSALDKLLAAQTIQDRTSITRDLVKHMYDEGLPSPGLAALVSHFGLQPTVAGFDMVSGPFGYPSSFMNWERWLWQTTAQ